MRENARVPQPPAPQPPLSPTLQHAVNKFAASLETPRRLLKLAPSQAGNPGNAGAINPAIVLTVTSAFEGLRRGLPRHLPRAAGTGLRADREGRGQLEQPNLE